MTMGIKQDGYSLVRGLHHVTTLASNANASNRFFTCDLGMRRIKQTVDFDSPDIYHLCYRNVGYPVTVMDLFPVS